MRVIYDLNKSDYKSSYKDLLFYFSSMSYKDKFDNKIIDYIKSEIIKFYAKYKTYLKIEGLDKYFAVALYQKIEKRGIKIINKNGGVIDVQHNMCIK